MINSVILVGRLTKDPELKRTQSGTPVCSFTLAVNRKSQAQGQPDADFINCVAWNKTAELMEEWLHKGSMIGVEGRIQTRNYDNQQGQRVYITEVVVSSITFLEPKGNAGAQNSNGYANSRQSRNQGYTSLKQSYYEQPSQTYAQGYEELDIASDDLPF